MYVEVKKQAEKDTVKLPIHIQLMAAAEIEKLKAANSLRELENVVPLEGTDEPFYRLKFNNYRFIFYYDETTNSASIRRLKHRKDSYKKHTLPWR